MSRRSTAAPNYINQVECFVPIRSPYGSMEINDKAKSDYSWTTGMVCLSFRLELEDFVFVLFFWLGRPSFWESALVTHQR